MDRISRFFIQLLLGLALSCLATLSARAQDMVAVFQPDLRQPYTEVFKAIVDGVEAHANFSVRVHKIVEDYDVDALTKWLKKHNIKAIIALGTDGLAAAKEAANGIPVLAASSLLSPDPAKPFVGGISLATDPDLVFEELKRLMPGVKKVCAVYSNTFNGWLMQQAQIAAEKRGIQLRALAAEDLRQAVLHYKVILNEMQTGKDALWLPLDPITVENRTALPLILRVSWDRNLTVVSSNAPHAKRGTLFSTFPEHDEMGKSIALTVNQWLSSPDPRINMVALRDVGIALNVRTAAHLGVRLDKEELAAYDLLFPTN